jgi:hypothetical protein
MCRNVKQKGFLYRPNLVFRPRTTVPCAFRPVLVSSVTAKLLRQDGLAEVTKTRERQSDDPRMESQAGESTSDLAASGCVFHIKKRTRGARTPAGAVAAGGE